MNNEFENNLNRTSTPGDEESVDLTLEADLEKETVLEETAFDETAESLENVTAEEKQETEIPVHMSAEQENQEEAATVSEENTQNNYSQKYYATDQNNSTGSTTFTGYRTTAPGINVTHNAAKKRKRVWPKVVALSVVAGILFGAAFGIVNGVTTNLMLKSRTVEPTKVTLNKGEATASGMSSVSKITQECTPSIVAITNRGVSDVKTFFGTYSQESTSSGSGIIIGQNDAELLIVTNYHVVANSRELSVVFSPVESKLESQIGQEGSANLDDEDIPNATVKGYDSNKDLAVIAVKLEDVSEDVLSQIKVATIGDSSTLKPGDQVIAIGNALGYGQSVTTGIISAVNRKITMESSDGSTTVTNSFIQTDAAINSGNSGGALLDMAGNLIGINSVKIATTGVEGMGYAIPISDVENIIDDLMVRQTRDKVEEKKQGFLGITGVDVTSTNNATFGIPIGVFVNSVTEGLAAEKAGIRKGYVITKFDGYTITTIAQLQERLQYYETGEKVDVIAMVPDGDKYKEKTFTVELSNRSENIEKVEE